ncbi:MAG: sigma-70 family RNA polymerase sigma factor [Planctomycetes bacterium]|nr:sigma-70 family RNA polymerase sigma factor [Planctomycetota bacterium]
MNTDPSSVTTLLHHARDNVPGGVERLFGACRNYLSIVARAQVESWLAAKFDASDLVQQTLLEAYRDFGSFRGATEAEWLAWLRQILSRNTANFHRHYRATGKRELRRETTTLLGDNSNGGAALLADRRESPSQLLIREERDLQIADALAQLPEDYQEVISLRNLQRMSFTEVAERMGRSRAAVQMLWGRALGRLQQAFAALQQAAPPQVRP